jgi:dUTPase
VGTPVEALALVQAQLDGTSRGEGGLGSDGEGS